jgi:hypothetical protein
MNGFIKNVKKGIDMKMLVSILIAGALSTASALAGAATTSPKVAGHDHAIATPTLVNVGAHHCRAGLTKRHRRRRVVEQAECH